MKLNIQEVTVKDLIALITIVCGFFLIAKGIDGTVGMALTLVVGFYFGGRGNE